MIIGNSGSGKSTLAQRLQSRGAGEWTDLDHIHWLDRVGAKRDEAEASGQVAALAAEDCWIIEGVYGWLAEAALPRATSLIWLDMSFEVCRDSLAVRGPTQGATEQRHDDFLSWAGDYWRRTTSSSFVGHQAMFARLAKPKIRFNTRGAVDAWLADLGRANLQPSRPPHDRV